MHHMLKEILTVNVPSLCVVNGLNIAGGVFMSLAHDKIIMNSNPKFTTCLNEAENGKVPTFAMEQFLRTITSGKSSRTLLLGTRVTPQEAKRLDLV